MAPQSPKPLPIKIFYSYSREDRELLDQLEKHLSSLKRRGYIKSWYDRENTGGQEWEKNIYEQLNSADIILLLISADYIASDFCYTELNRAMQRHEAGESRIVPIILRPCHWADLPFSKIQVLPDDARPIISWFIPDEGFLSVVKGILKVVEELIGTTGAALPLTMPQPSTIGFIARRDRNNNDITNRLKEILSQQKQQLIALWGPGGVGKTTLAAAVARLMSGFFYYRIIWINALSRANLSYSMLLDEMSLQLVSTDSRRRPLKQKEKEVQQLIKQAPTLTVVDNFEAIALEEQARCIDFLNRLQYPALITSRNAISDAFRIYMYPMTVKEAREFLHLIINQTRDPSAFAGLDFDSIIQVAKANPLVLQWVVKHLELAPDPHIVLNDLLQDGESDVTEIVFDRFFDMPQIGEDGRVVLLALSLFVPHASRKALAEVTKLNGGLQRLDQIIKHLVDLRLAATTVGDERILVEGMTRELAAARLAKDERGDSIRQQFIKYFLDYATKHTQPTLENFAALELEKDNVLSAINMMFKIEDEEEIKQIVDAISFDSINKLLGVRSYWDEEIRTGEQAPKATLNMPTESQIARFAHDVALIYQDRGELSGAQRLYDESLKLYEQINDQIGIASAKHQLATIAQDQGNAAKAQQLYLESLEIKKRLNDRRGIASTLNNLGMIAVVNGDLAEAQRLYNESLNINTELNDESGIANTKQNLAMLEEERGNIAEAATLLREALSIFEKLKSPFAELTRRSLERLESEPSMLS